MERLTERLNDELNGVWVKDHDYISAAHKLAEYEDLEEQGKLLKLPCAAGDTIYRVCIPKNDEPQIIEMKVGCVEPCGAIRNYKGTCEVWNVYAETDYTKAYFKFFDFGKTVFLTGEEAEAALKELRRGKEERAGKDFDSD
jgi:hypothetical protein